MTEPGWRVALISTVPPVAEIMTTALRDLGHEPVAVVTARRKEPIPDRPSISDETAPAGLDVLLARDKWSMEPLLRAADGQRVRLIRTSLTDPGGGAKWVECGDGPLWIVASEPLP
jgi:hypothetical protein